MKIKKKCVLELNGKKAPMLWRKKVRAFFSKDASFLEERCELFTLFHGFFICPLLEVIIPLPHFLLKVGEGDNDLYQRANEKAVKEGKKLAPFF